MENKENINVLREIMADLAIHKEPDFLSKDIADLLDLKSVNMILVDRYYDLLSHIKYALEKVLRYEKYFADFYVVNKDIEEFEQLNHHIHAYLQDLDTLKNKMVVFLGSLKNDFKKEDDSKKEIILIESAIQKTGSVFEGALQHRRSHVYAGPRFMDGDLLKAENAYGAIDLFSNPEFIEMANNEKRLEFLEKRKKEKEESFEVAKGRYIEMARNNREQITGYTNALMRGIRPVLYNLLKVQSVKGIIDNK